MNIYESLPLPHLGEIHVSVLEKTTTNYCFAF